VKKELTILLVIAGLLIAMNWNELSKVIQQLKTLEQIKFCSQCESEK